MLVSDGELNEGSNRVALTFAAHHGLGRLTSVFNANDLQNLTITDATLNMGSLCAIFQAFGTDVAEIGSHDHAALRAALTRASTAPAPRS